MIVITRTSQFLLPALKLDNKLLMKFGFINAYIKDVDYDKEIDKCLFLLFNVPEKYNLEFGEFVLNKEGQLQDEYTSEGYIVLVFDFPKKWSEEWDRFLESKYSKFSSEYKGLFSKQAKEVEKHYINSVASYSHQVVTKDPDLRRILMDALDEYIDKDVELCNIISMERETLDISKILNQESV